ncbi:AP3-complex subunit beta-A [Elaeis guineensis]|uniref:AP-3 complex subunit beta n=1 Tax=Elaeis guineensis var. tenera TaxID=51953 RepID=A0A6I9SDH2_ELAGV|nr:AP3-complex subunit beta-A isoform X2 [Elaeis guineensis]
MFPQFGATAESLSKASSLVLRIGTDAHLYDDPDDVNIAPLLDSRFDSEKSEALKRLLALIAQGDDVSHFFPQVVKNVASQSLEVKKLVYLYLLHYAEKRPNEALLSINCFQKDLSDTNPLVRAWALRAMAGIRLHVVAPLVLAAVSKCARDPSAYVRKCAAHALPKIYDLHQDENTSALEELVDILLSDHSPGVIGAAAAAFNAVCPNNLPLIAKHFRRLCEMLPDVEEWGQILLIEILLRYVVARHGLVKESIMLLNSTTSSQSDKDSAAVGNMSDGHCGSVGGEAYDFKLNLLMCRYYIEETKECLAQSGPTNEDDNNLGCLVLTSSQNDDVKILLQCTSPLLWSQNSAVVLAAAGVYWIMAPRAQVERIVKPVLFILRSSHASKYVMLCNILVFAKTVPSLFAPYFEDFFVCSSDPYHIRALKLEILSTIATESSVPIIFEEFQDYIKDPDRRFVADTVAAIGLCAQRLPAVAATCLEGLLALVRHESSINISGNIDGEANVLVQAIMSIKAIIKENPTNHEKVIVHLVRNLDIVKEPAARALIIWIIGEYSSVGQLIPKIVPTVLKYLAWSFTSEELETKLQILNSTWKVALRAQGEELYTFRKILSYIIELARCDMNYDVRDRSRVVEEITSCPMQNGGIYREFVESIFCGKTPSKAYMAENFRIYLPGSLSQIVLHAAPGYRPLPKPCSLIDGDFNLRFEVVHEPQGPAEIIGRGNSFEMNDPDISSGSSMEESGSAYDSQHSSINSADSDGTGFASDSNDNGHTLVVSHGAGDGKEIPLVHLSDVSVDYGQTSQSAKENISTFISKDLAEVLSKSALESWLDEQPNLPSLQKSEPPSSAKISIKDLNFTVKPKLHTLLDPANANGLRVEYSFSSEVSTISPLLVCVDMIFKNLSTEPLTNITVKDGESSGSLESADQVFEEPESLLSANDGPTILPMEELASLDPGQTVKKVLQVRFRHHLLPLKLAVFCNGKKKMTKLWPDIGYFMRPLPMDMKVFSVKERELPGMFEYSKRCIFKDHVEEIDHEKDQRSLHTDDILLVSRSLASKVLSNANVHLVSVDIPVSLNADDASGLCLRFTGEILNSSKPCLISLTAEGKLSESLNVTVKVNCEDTIFGLNLLNRAVTFLL